MTTRDEIEALIARVGLGDRAAFAALYAATAAKLYGLALRVLQDEAEAQDALQDAFVKVWHNAPRYAANGLSPMTWLITLARNAAIDRLRRRPRAGLALDGDDGGAVADRLADPGPTPEAAAIAASEGRRIAACLDELEPARAAAVRGAYLEGLSYEALAARHGVPLNTMRSWLRRSLIKLRECLTR